VPKQSHGPTEIAAPSARNDALPGNPKLEALNPEQIQKSKIKNQNYNSKIKKLHF